MKYEGTIAGWSSTQKEEYASVNRNLSILVKRGQQDHQFSIAAERGRSACRASMAGCPCAACSPGKRATPPPPPPPTPLPPLSLRRRRSLRQPNPRSMPALHVGQAAPVLPGRRAKAQPLRRWRPRRQPRSFHTGPGQPRARAGVRSLLQPPGPRRRSAHGRAAARAAAPGARRRSCPAPWAMPCPAKQGERMRRSSICMVLHATRIWRAACYLCHHAAHA